MLSVYPLRLIIGNKNYSSWSLRPWLVMKQVGIPFEEVRIPLCQPDSRAQILKHSPSGRVSVLVDGSRRIWDSLAICEYLAECYPKHELWPRDSRRRAAARSICAEMHSGFQLREHMPMNCRARLPAKGREPGVEEDIHRVLALWEDCRKHSASGNFLFGHFTIADAMYAPVVLRFLTYAVEVPPVTQAYMDTVVNLPAMREWLGAARAETEIIPQYEGTA